MELGAQVELPLWLALHLAQRDVCELKRPEYLGEKYLQALEAGPEILNLRSQSPAIYENALKLCAHLEEPGVAEILQRYLTAFLERFGKNVLDLADSGEILQNEQFLADQKRLSNLERELLSQHRRQRVMNAAFRNKQQLRQVDISCDLMDDDMKASHKRMRQ